MVREKGDFNHGVHGEEDGKLWNRERRIRENIPPLPNPLLPGRGGEGEDAARNATTRDHLLPDSQFASIAVIRG